MKNKWLISLVFSLFLSTVSMAQQPSGLTVVAAGHSFDPGTVPGYALGWTQGTQNSTSYGTARLAVNGNAGAPLNGSMGGLTLSFSSLHEWSITKDASGVPDGAQLIDVTFIHPTCNVSTFTTASASKPPPGSQFNNQASTSAIWGSASTGETAIGTSAGGEMLHQQAGPTNSWGTTLVVRLQRDPIDGKFRGTLTAPIRLVTISMAWYSNGVGAGCSVVGEEDWDLGHDATLIYYQ